MRSRFREKPPAASGDEKTWTTQYISTRHNWLATHHRRILRLTIYHTKTLQNEIERDNWDLSKLPIDANGVMVDGSNDSARVAETVRREDGTVPFFDDLHDVSAPSTVNLERVRDLGLHVDLSDLGLARYKPLVEEVQRRLIDMGFLNPPVDGSFGPLSTLALETVREYGLHSDDEVIDGKMARLLLNMDSDRFVPVYPDNDLQAESTNI